MKPFLNVRYNKALYNGRLNGCKFLGLNKAIELETDVDNEKLEFALITDGQVSIKDADKRLKSTILKLREINEFNSKL